MENQVYMQRIIEQAPKFAAESKQGTINITEV